MTDGLWSPVAISRLDLQHLLESKIYWRGRRSLTSSAKSYALQNSIGYGASACDLVPVFFALLKHHPSICPTLQFDLS